MSAAKGAARRRVRKLCSRAAGGQGAWAEVRLWTRSGEDLEGLGVVIREERRQGSRLEQLE